MHLLVQLVPALVLIARPVGLEDVDRWRVEGGIDVLGEEKTKAIFTDTTHTRPEGADMNAAGVIAGLKALDNPLMKFLSEKGKAVEAYKKPAN